MTDIIITPAPPADLRRALFQTYNHPPSGPFKITLLVDDFASQVKVAKEFVSAFGLEVRKVKKAGEMLVAQTARQITPSDCFVLNGTCMPSEGVFDLLRAQGKFCYAEAYRFKPEWADLVGQYGTELTPKWASEAEPAAVFGLHYIPARYEHGPEKCYGARVYGADPAWGDYLELTDEIYDNRAIARL
jgi:hypothetical protein